MCKSNTQVSFLPDDSYGEHKSAQHPIISLYSDFNEKKADTLRRCGNELYFFQEHHIDTHEQRETLAFMYTCKDRFCPFCNWRRARKLAIQTYEVLDHIQTVSNRTFRFLHLTLTVRNPLLDDTHKCIVYMNKSFSDMMRLKRVRESILGYVKVLEIHPQKDDFHFTHPHFHVLVAVSISYFNTNCSLYINQNEWCELWRLSLGVDYRPSVYVRVIRPKMAGIDAIASAVAEVCKYPFKSADFENYPSDLFQIFTDQLFALRRVSTGGKIKKVRRLLNLEDSEEGDLIYESEKDQELWEKISLVMYKYDDHFQNYVYDGTTGVGDDKFCMDDYVRPYHE